MLVLGAVTVASLSVAVGLAPASVAAWVMVGVALVAASLGLSALVARGIDVPVRELTETAGALRAGDLTARMRSSRRDELGTLASALDSLADHWVERIEAARREEARLRTMLDAMVEAVFVTDREGKIVLTNAALDALAGSSLQGRSAIEAIRSPELHESVQQALRGSASRAELGLVTLGQTRSLAAHVAPLPSREGVVAVLHDLTELKRAESVRRDFVANASHELRTPLTSIRGFAETLLDGALGDPRMAPRFLGNILENSKRLERLVDDLLELSRAESPESAVELAEVDVARVALLVLQGLESRTAEKKIDVSLEAPSEVVLALADARALDQVLLNLVDNAVKYTPSGGRVWVRVERREGEVLIEVADDGPGIPRAHLDRIFERFYRVDKGRSREAGGTGLGLSIVRHFVQRMKGRVAVESTVGEGTTFRVVLAAA
jgi:two-component system phosphate regulon sensor histidine kinase PhoR